MSNPYYACPECGHRKFQVSVRQLADVFFTTDGDHEVDDVYGDVDFDDASGAICVDCGWAGTIGDAKKGE